MLVLTRKVGEGIAIGNDVKIVVMQIKGKQVRLGIQANSNTIVHREEVFNRIQDENLIVAKAEYSQVRQASKVIGKSAEVGSLTPVRRIVKGQKGPDSED